MTRETQNALLTQLKNPFDPRFVKWRVGATNQEKTNGIALAYIDSREVMKRLDDVMGVGGWQSRYIPMDGGFICELGLFINGQWVWKANTAGYTNVDPIKGGGSDALKRAAAAWGVGRYLYYLPNIWVPIKPQGKSYVLAEQPELPDWAMPNIVENWEDVAELQAEISSTEDFELFDDNEFKKAIESALTLAELTTVFSNLSASQKKEATPLVAKKKKELANVAAN